MRPTLSGALEIYAVLVAWIAVVLLAASSWNNLRVEIELRHPDLWRRLGSPGFVNAEFRFGHRHHRKFTRYVIAGRYRRSAIPRSPAWATGRASWDL